YERPPYETNYLRAFVRAGHMRVFSRCGPGSRSNCDSIYDAAQPGTAGNGVLSRRNGRTHQLDDRSQAKKRNPVQTTRHEAARGSLKAAAGLTKPARLYKGHRNHGP